jgi:predicted NACHT family NTPase
MLLTFIGKIFPLHFDFGGALAPLSVDAEDVKYNAFRSFIDSLGPLIILDGFDEYPSIEGRERLADEIRQLTLSLRKAKVVVTCRTGEFFHKFENTNVFEIAPLRPEQIRSFATKWISGDKDPLKFLSKLAHSPYADTAMKPLLLGHLCAIYERAEYPSNQRPYIVR